MTKEIQLPKGYVAIVDDEDLDNVAGYKWLSLTDKSGNIYVRANVCKDNTVKTVYMHRLLMGVTDAKIFVDHINGDCLDNRRSNLRLCTNAENGRNRGVSKRSSSGVKCVSWVEKNKKWVASIGLNGKTIHLGLFSAQSDAASAYKAAAIECHGEFARFG